MVVVAAVMCVAPCFAADVDADGMEDKWETTNSLNPNDPTDGAKDPDYDNYTNLEEFQLKGNPKNADSPVVTVFVAKTGTNAADRGSYKEPYLTIGYALSQVKPSGSKPVRIVVGGGIYDEDLTLKNYATITGSIEPPTSPDKARITYATITGNHTGANRAGLENLILIPVSTSIGTLRVLDNIMFIRACVFQGPGLDNLRPNAGVGIQVQTDRSDGITLEKCEFAGFTRAIQVAGDFPLIRQCYFHDITEEAIDIVGGRTFTTVSLGNANDSRTGFNSFDLSSIGGSVISTDWSGTLRMENNMWNTSNTALIAERLNTQENTFDFDPPGDETTYSLLPASIACTVMNGSSNQRIENAQVYISPSIYDPITDNEDGVYTVPSILPGNYNILVQAPDYEDASQSVYVQQAEIRAVVVEMEKFQTGDLNRDNILDIGELLRYIQIYNSNGYHCDEDGEDGFAIDQGNTNCTPHTIDYFPQDWYVSLDELLRAIQLYNSFYYHSCPDEASEDGFCVGPPIGS